jgi:diguanylate cyclase (GGDEF)-like protein
LSADHQPIVLCVDDDPDVLGALRAQLDADLAGKAGILTASSAEDALARVELLGQTGATITVVIADQTLIGMSGVALLEQLRERTPHTMRMLLTGAEGGAQVAALLSRASAHAFVGKPWSREDLVLTVRNLLEQARLSDENRRLVATLSAKNQALLALNRELEAKVAARTRDLADANSRLSQLAVTDGLTGLYNHRYFYERLALEVERSQRNGLPLSLLMIDVDHFKQYNDRLGHPAGDEVLKTISRMLGDGRRANDIVCRYGGEEFVVLLVETSRFEAAKIAERLRHKISTHAFAEASAQPLGRLSVSIGVATSPDDGSDGATLVRAADQAMYAAKNAGRDLVVIASPPQYTDSPTVSSRVLSP